jgi:hypothetical protein
VPILPTSAGRALRRITAHLTRTKARAGWTLTAVSVLGYFASGDVAALQQFWLVLTGVAAGAVFLPDLGEDLWTLKADQVRLTVPGHRISELQRALIRAECRSEDWADIVWHEGLSPLLDAGSNLDQVVWDAKYDIVIYLDQQEIGGHRFHRVETLSRARRMLPSVRSRRYWVSAARTPAALLTEYHAPNCLTRELIVIPEIEPTRWRDVVASSCDIRIAINGINLAVQVDDSDRLLDTVRWYFEVPVEDWTDQVVPLSLQFDFVLPGSDHSFPVFFNSYYSAGTTEISLRLKGAAADCALTCTKFVAHGLGGRTGDIVESSSGNTRFVLFSTPRSSLLWPGAGILFQW